MQGESGWLARAGSRIADACERWFPDAFVFALAAIVVVFLGGLGLGIAPQKLAVEFGNGFWSLVNFTMQMALIIIGGFVVATSPPVARLTARLASIPKTPRGAVAFVAAFSMITSLLSWGLSLIFTGLLVRQILRRLPGVDYRAIGAAAYLGLGSVWALGLSSSSALMQATRSAIPPSLLPITGVIPLSQTIFLWQSITMAVVLIAVSIAIAWYSAPPAHRAKRAPEMPGLAEEERFVPATPAELLRDLELRLGIVDRGGAEADRVVAFAARVRALGEPQRYYGRSFEVDALGTSVVFRWATVGVALASLVAAAAWTRSASDGPDDSVVGSRSTSSTWSGYSACMLRTSPQTAAPDRSTIPSSGCVATAPRVRTASRRSPAPAVSQVRAVRSTSVNACTGSAVASTTRVSTADDFPLAGSGSGQGCHRTVYSPPDPIADRASALVCTARRASFPM